MLEYRGRCVELLVVIVVLCVHALHGLQNNGDVAVKWGVADSTATVGKLFRLHIPGDSFSGSNLSYKVQRPGGLPLPDWLQFNVKDNVLEGIPTPGDAGQLYLEITAQGSRNQATVTTTVYVRDVSSHTSGMPLRFRASGPDFVQCEDKESETVATIFCDANLESLSITDRLALLKKFISHMDLHEEMIKMLPVGNSPMHDSSALVSGTGDCLTPKTSGLFMSWPVGCGKVKEGHFPVLQRLDDDSGSGKMAKVLGYPVIGWQVTNSHFQAPARKRRQVHATPTPAVTPIIPTKTETKPEKTDDEEGRLTHQVAITPSPTFTQPIATHSSKTDDHVVLPSVKVDGKPGKVMPAEIMTKSVHVTKTKELPQIIPTKTYDKSEPTKVFKPDGDCIPNQAPLLKSEIPQQVVHVGEVIEFLIPEDTFEDCEVGGTRGLELKLFKEDMQVIPGNFFLQFDAKAQKIVGLPLESNAARHKFSLIAAKKSNDQLVKVNIIYNVKSKTRNRINHELSLTLDLDYDQFMANVTDRVNLAKKVARVYGDPNPKNLVVTSIKQGSVIYSWTNSSIGSTKDCPTEKITELVRKLVNEDGTLNENAVKKLKPYTLVGAAAVPVGSCKNNSEFPSVVSKPRVPTTSVDEEVDEEVIEVDKPEVDDKEKKTKEMDTTTVASVAKGAKDGEDEDDIWITTVIPAVVIVVILLIALLIACILYRKKRKGKLNVEEQNTFINKGAPVIFPDELEDKPTDVNKPLLVEGSPAPPPVYHRGPSESPERLLSSNTRNNKNNLAPSGAIDRITEMPQKPYEPPPPVTASSSNKQPRTTHQQQPYSQPPQILP